MGLKTIGRFTYDSATPQVVDAGGNIPFSTETATCNLSCDGETVTIDQCGVFLVLADVTFVAEETGTIEAQLYRNGNAVPGAHTYATAAAEGDYAPVSFCTVISIPRCGQATVNVKVTEATNVTVANLIVMKVA